MAKGIHSKHRSRARRPSPEKAPSRLQTHAQTTADLADRDFLAAILDAASEDHGLDKYLSQVVAHLSKYARCNCIGIILFTDDGIVGCTSYHASAAEFTRIPKGSFPGSEKCICSSLLKGQSNIRPAGSTEGGAFFRNSKSAPSTRTEIADETFGICMGSTFESVALIPTGDPKTVAGFIFMGDERKDRIPQRKLNFLERVGAHVGSTVRALQAQDKLDRMNHSLPGPEGKTATTPHDADEMELVTRLIENSNESIVITQDWRIIYVNKKCADMAGLSKQDMIGLAFLDITHPDDRPAVVERYSRILNGEWFQSGTVLRGLDKDGNTRWAELREIPFSWHGRPAVMSLVNDITDRKRAEEALAESEKKYKDLFEHTLLGMEVVDGQTGRTVLANRSLARMFGFKTPADMVGTNPLDYVLPEDVEWVVSQIAQLMADPAWAKTALIRSSTKDGRIIWLTGMGTPIEYEGRPAMLLSLVDTTAAKEAETRLHESEERYRLVVENANEAIVVLQDGLVKFANPKGAELVGRSGEGLAPTPFLDFIHPDDRQMMMENHVKRLAGDDVPNNYTFRMIDRQGSTRWIQINAVRLDWEGKPAILAMLNDTTDSTKAEDALKASEEKFRALAENSSDMIVLLNKSGVISYESPAAGRLLGLSPEERIGERPFERVHPDDLPRVTGAFVELMRNPGAGPGRIDELRLQHGDGSWRTMEATGSAIVRGGDVEGIVVTLHDITERKKAEEALKASEERFRTIIENARDAITIVDDNFSVMYESPSLGVVTGYPPEEWLGKSLGDMQVHPDDMPFLASEFEKLKSQPGLVIEDACVRYQHTDGSWHVIEATARNLLHDPKVNGIVVNFRDITTRKRAEEAQRESEKRYRLLAENITDVIWTTDMQTNITYMSPSATRLVGFSMEELSKMSVADLLTPDSFERGMEALAERHAKESQEPGSQPDYWTIQVEMRRKDGSTVWVEETVAFLHDEDGTPIGLVGATRDISRRKMIEDALRMSEDKYRTLVEASPDGVLSIDGRGIITDCNTGLCKMLGYERKQLCGREARQLETKKNLDAEAYYHAHLIQGEFMEVETEILRHDGQALPVWAKLVRLAEPSTADIQTIIYFRDIADRRKIDEMKDEFVGLVSHELRSPLTVIIGALHTAISEGPRLSQKETRQLLNDAAAEAEQLSHLVGNLLELSRAQANRLFLHVEPINMAKAVHKVIASVERQSSKHKFVADLPKRLPAVSADQLRLERILHNLLENSVKYSPEGSEITVSAKRDAGQLVLSVSDHGPGISKEDQAKLFKPFQQLGDPMLDHTKGAGLGLLVCRRLVEAHGGRIWVESEPGHGTSFRFTLEASTKDGPEAG